MKLTVDVSPEVEASLTERAQAEAAAPMYAADLARPVHERKLTAFTALNVDPLYEYSD